jgi:hypothetical protein
MQIKLKMLVVMVIVLVQLNSTNVKAGDGNLVIGREVPHQPVRGYRHTGRVHQVDVGPDEQVNSMADTSFTELTDMEAAGVTGGMSNRTLSPTLINGRLMPIDRATASTINTLSSTTLSPIGTLGTVTSGVGGRVTGATGGLSNTLGRILPQTGGM